jgi:predicted membrane protein
MKTSRARSNVLLAAAAWTVYVWVTRMWNIARDSEHSFGFKAVHGVLAVVSVAFAVAIGVIGFRMRREARGRTDAVEPAASSGAPTAPDGDPRDHERAVGR